MGGPAWASPGKSIRVYLLRVEYMDNAQKSVILNRARAVSNKELALELDYKFRREKRLLEHTPALFRSPRDKRRLATLQALSRALGC